MLLFGLVAEKRCGKDTLADYVTEQVKEKKKVYRYAFAEPLKECCRVIFGLNDEQLYGEEKETEDSRFSMTPRVLMQRLGTELFREHFDSVFPELGYGRQLWIKILENKLKNHENEDCIVFITDVRFSDELKFISRQGGTLVKITSNKRLKNNKKDSHVSENELKNNKDYDYLIENDGTLEEYYRKIDDLLTIKKI